MFDKIITWLIKRLILLWDRHNDKIAFSFGRDERTDCYYCRAKDDGRCASLAATPCRDVWLDWLKQEVDDDNHDH